MREFICERLALLREIERPLWVRVLFGIWALSGAWDIVLQQWIPDEYAKRLPKAYQVIAMTVGLASWQVWMLVGAAIAVLVSIEFSFRKVRAAAARSATQPISTTSLSISKNDTNQGARVGDVVLDSTKLDPLGIELGTDKNYVREEHLENGMLRKSIYVSIYNNGDTTAYDCNIKLIASTPVLTTGNARTKYPVFFGTNFNLVSKERAFVKLLSFAESGSTNALERDNLLISAAVGGWVSREWTTLSPLPTQGNPGVLTLEAFARGVVSGHAQIKIWVDETLGRKLYARID
jgi:hypothetical protein